MASNLVTSGSILQILVAQGVLTPAQATAIPSSNDNAAIELFLRLNQLASDEQILQAYAAVYGVPFIHLRGRRIRPEIIGLIPELTARRYDIVAYDRHGDTVQVAIASPRRMKGNQRGKGILHRLQSDLKLKIAPAFATTEDVRASFFNYEAVIRTPVAPASPAPSAQAPQPTVTGSVPAAPSSPANPTARPAFPKVSLQDLQINLPILQRFPEEVAKHYGFIAFAEPRPNHFLIAALDPAGKATQQVLGYLQKHNQVSVSLYQTDKASLEAALAQYHPGGSVQSAAAASPLAGNTTQLPNELDKTSQPNPANQPGQPVAQTSSPAGAATPAAPAGVPEITADQVFAAGDSLTKLQTAEAEAAEGSKSKIAPENSLSEFLGGQVHVIDDLMKIVRSGNIPKTVAGIVSLAISYRASDVHIEAEKTKIRLRYRIDGELEDALLIPRVLLAPLVSRIKILSQLKIDENRVPQDGRFAVSYENREIDLRVSTLPTVHGEKVVIRILDKTTGVMSLEDMGIGDENLKRLVANISKPYGIILSTGPTGSGKSTTLYAILQRISQPEVNVITLEDPVEYEISGINQTQIKPKIGFTFAEGLRSILRQDPNIIMVGEIRDKETAEMATHAALTGHLVLSTLHTNTASGALPRLINMGIEPFLITSSMNAVIGQRLVRRVCPNCKVEDTVPEVVFDEIERDLKNANVDEKMKDRSNWHFVRGKGCADCNNGYKGRIGIFEVMIMSDDIETLAVKKEPASVIEAQALKEGMVTMKQDGLIKAIKGFTTIEEVMKATTE